MPAPDQIVSDELLTEAAPLSVTSAARCAARLGDVFRLEADIHLDPSRPGDWRASVHSDRTDPSAGLPYEAELAILLYRLTARTPLRT